MVCDLRIGVVIIVMVCSVYILYMQMTVLRINEKVKQF